MARAKAGWEDPKRQGPQDGGCVAASLSPLACLGSGAQTRASLYLVGGPALADRACPRGDDVTASWPRDRLCRERWCSLSWWWGRESRLPPDSGGRGESDVSDAYVTAPSCEALPPFRGLSADPRGHLRAYACVCQRARCLETLRLRQRGFLEDEVEQGLSWGSGRVRGRSASLSRFTRAGLAGVLDRDVTAGQSGRAEGGSRVVPPREVA